MNTSTAISEMMRTACEVLNFGEPDEITILRPMKKRFVVGIDPGVNTGFALWDRLTTEIRMMHTWDFWKVIDWFRTGPISIDPNNYFVIIETPNAARTLYARKDDQSEGRGRERMASNVGSNRREAELLADGIERLGFEVRRVTPTRSKWTAADLKRKTGITQRTNEHVRDAIALVYGI